MPAPQQLPTDLLEDIGNYQGENADVELDPATIDDISHTHRQVREKPARRKLEADQFPLLYVAAADLEWHEQGLCGQTDPEAFFPEKGGSTREAKLVCRSCEVRAECLQQALTTNERFGIWGGYSERERRNMLRQGFGAFAGSAAHLLARVEAGLGPNQAQVDDEAEATGMSA